jgi:enolase
MGSLDPLTSCDEHLLLSLRSDELIEMYKAFTKDFPVISIEDPFDQDDIEHSKKLTAEGVCQVHKLPMENLTTALLLTPCLHAWCNT